MTDLMMVYGRFLFLKDLEARKKYLGKVGTG